MKKTEFLTAKALQSPRPDWVKQVTAIVFWVTSAAGIITMTITSIPLFIFLNYFNSLFIFLFRNYHTLFSSHGLLIADFLNGTCLTLSIISGTPCASVATLIHDGRGLCLLSRYTPPLLYPLITNIGA